MEDDKIEVSTNDFILLSLNRMAKSINDIIDVVNSLQHRQQYLIDRLTRLSEQI